MTDTNDTTTPPAAVPPPALPPGFTGSATFAQVVAGLVAARKDFQSIDKAKTAKAGSFTYAYADLAACLRATTPALTERGLYVTQPAKREGNEIVIRTVLWHSTGEWLSPEPLTMPVSDNRDPQKIGSAVSYARRYAYCSLLGIAAEDEDDDAVAAREGNERRDRRPERQAQPQTRRQEPREAPAEASAPAATEAAPVDPNDTRKCTRDQLRRLVSMLKEHDVDQKAFGGYLKEVYAYTKWEDIERRHYDAIVALAQNFHPTSTATTEASTETSGA